MTLHSLNPWELFIKQLLLTHHNKMVLLNAKIKH
uniref:Uncharacterized protein n=1 Tax=Rhizophora mucronata TaxID=61149 RepID=A0A2P2PJ93_RHIMU